MQVYGRYGRVDPLRHNICYERPFSSLPGLPRDTVGPKARAMWMMHIGAFCGRRITSTSKICTAACHVNRDLAPEPLLVPATIERSIAAVFWGSEKTPTPKGKSLGFPPSNHRLLAVELWLLQTKFSVGCQVNGPVTTRSCPLSQQCSSRIMFLLLWTRTKLALCHRMIWYLVSFLSSLIHGDKANLGIKEP